MGSILKHVETFGNHSKFTSSKPLKNVLSKPFELCLQVEKKDKKPIEVERTSFETIKIISFETIWVIIQL
jgi:hypothetical protein